MDTHTLQTDFGKYKLIGAQFESALL